jgi:hypothetical protein
MIHPVEIVSGFGSILTCGTIRAYRCRSVFDPLLTLARSNSDRVAKQRPDPILNGLSVRHGRA